MSYILRAQRVSDIPILGPRYILHGYMDPLGVISFEILTLSRTLRLDWAHGLGFRV